MAKIVSLSPEAYEALERLKEPGDSFSDVVLALAERERMRRLEALMGSWKMSASEADAMTKEIYARRARSRPRRADL